jgi:phosphatidylglycerol:prolipoprotein diacylglycerol transferase
VNLYPVILAAGLLAGWLRLGAAAPARAGRGSEAKRSWYAAARVDASLASLAGALVGGRAAHVALHWSYYSGHPIEVVWFWQGGLSWVGAALGAVLGVGLYARLARQPFWALADALTVPAMLVAVAAWIGCLADGCAYGRRTDPGPFTPSLPDMFGVVAPRWPTQAVGALSAVAGWRLFSLHERRGAASGTTFLFGMAWLAGTAMLLSFTRGDPALLIGPYRLDSWAAAALLAAALLGGWIRTRAGPAPRDTHAAA